MEAPAEEAMAAAVAAMAAATETTGEATHNCHPADVVHGAVLMGMNIFQNWYFPFIALRVVATTATATPFYPASSFTQAHRTVKLGQYTWLRPLSSVHCPAPTPGTLDGGFESES